MSNLISRANDDAVLIEMWLHNRPSGTQKNYRRDVRSLLDFVGKSLQEVALEDLQAYASHLNARQLKDATKRSKLNAIKSLFTFGTRLNYFSFNLAAALRIPKRNSILAGRVVKQLEIFKLIDRGTSSLRDRALLKLLYGCGLRVSEGLQLNWDDFTERDSGEVQVQVLGKGQKLRVVLVPLQVWMELEALKGNASGEAPVFTSCRGKRLDRTMAHKIIKQAATKAGVSEKISCHWLRHSHATHALSKGAPISLVRDSLGHSNISVTNVYLESNPSDGSSNYLGL